MNEKINSKLGFGPMSPEIIEGIIKASSLLGKSMMLISTMNQINCKGGYVNNWTTNQYAEFVGKMKKKYSGSKIYLCRDHCGPGFGDFDIEDVYKTVSDDIENNFDLIHIDYSKANLNKKVILDETKRVIEWILNKNEKIGIEVGTEDNKGEFKNNIVEIQEELDFIKKVIIPEFWVVQTGSLVKEINQIGSFNKIFIEKVHKLLKSNSIKLKEHNADYLDYENIKKRNSVIDAMNIAPQLGVLQTISVINEALVYGIDIEPFMEVSYNSKKWEKWLYVNTPENKMLCSIISGHYNYTSHEYQELVSKLGKITQIKELIIDKIVNLIKYYVKAFDF